MLEPLRKHITIILSLVQYFPRVVDDISIQVLLDFLFFFCVVVIDVIMVGQVMFLLSQWFILIIY